MGCTVLTMFLFPVLQHYIYTYPPFSNEDVFLMKSEQAHNKFSVLLTSLRQAYQVYAFAWQWSWEGMKSVHKVCYATVVLRISCQVS